MRVSVLSCAGVMCGVICGGDVLFGARFDVRVAVRFGVCFLVWARGVPVSQWAGRSFHFRGHSHSVVSSHFTLSARRDVEASRLRGKMSRPGLVRGDVEVRACAERCRSQELRGGGVEAVAFLERC